MSYDEEWTLSYQYRTEGPADPGTWQAVFGKEDGSSIHSSGWCESKDEATFRLLRWLEDR